jgi:hypothetical protein
VTALVCRSNRGVGQANTSCSSTRRGLSRSRYLTTARRRLLGQVFGCHTAPDTLSTRRPLTRQWTAGARPCGKNASLSLLREPLGRPEPPLFPVRKRPASFLSLSSTRGDFPRQRFTVTHSEGIDNSAMGGVKRAPCAGWPRENDSLLSQERRTVRDHRHMTATGPGG